MDENILAAEAHLFDLRPVTQFIMGNLRETYSRPAFVGNNPPYGLILTAYFGSTPKTKPFLRVKDSLGEEIYKAELPLTEGLHRLYWNLQSIPKTEKEEKPVISGPVFSALPFVSPGEFSAELELDGRTCTRAFIVQPDPRFEWPEEDRVAQKTAVAEVINLHSALSRAVTALSGIKREAEDLRKQIDQNKDLGDKAGLSLSALENALQPLSSEIMPRPFNSGEPGLAQKLLMAGASLANYPGRPTEMELSQIKSMKAKVAGLLDRLNIFIRDGLPDLNKGLEENGLKSVKVPKEVVF
jgi:hypothetical protein